MKTAIKLDYVGTKELDKGVEREVVEILIKNHAELEDLQINVGFGTENEAKCFLATWNMCRGLTIAKLCKKA